MKWVANPKVQIVVSIFMIGSGVILWPISLFIFKEEPPIVLSLSWLALIYGGWGGLVAAILAEEEKKKK